MNHAPAAAGPLYRDLAFTRKALVFVDVVESLQLMRAHEADVIDRWTRYVAEVQRDVLPNRGGRLVKSYGDGLLLEFDEVPAAVASALELQQRIGPYNQHRATDAQIHLRAGVHVGDVAVVPLDLQGIAVNDTQRICSLAAPGETLVSAAARDRLVLGVDPDLEDLGERYARHVDAPYRVYRLLAEGTPGGAAPSMLSRLHELRPGIAVIPFECNLGGDPGDVLGEALADEVISQLAPSPELHVISGLSTRGLKGRKLGIGDIARHLNAAYVVSGR